MSGRRLSLVSSAMLAFACFAGEADTSGIQLSPQTSTIALDPIADQTQGPMIWRRGSFVYRNSRSDAGGHPTFYILNREGGLVSSVTPSIPDAAQVWVSAFDRGADGAIVFSGGSNSPYGEGEPFIVSISPDGQTSRVIRTAPYWAYMLSVAPDGTIWTVGLEAINGKTNVPGVNLDAGVLRHFDRSGRLIGSAAPQREFGSNRLEGGYLVATRDRIGWYSPKFGRGDYVEISPDTMTPQGHPGLPDLSGGGHPGLVTNFVLTDEGNAFLSFQDNNTHHRTTYAFDRGASRWVPVQVPTIDGRAGPNLEGCDGEQLVFKGGHSVQFFSVSR